jgi:hypothetical protein
MFELRVNKSVCHFVTIIVRTLGNIQVFFIIFAAGIIAFAIAILHLLRGSPVHKRDQDYLDNNVTFPGHFYQAIATTYFYMVRELTDAHHSIALVFIINTSSWLRAVSGIPQATTFAMATLHSKR